jgi:hypothetical protein
MRNWKYTLLLAFCLLFVPLVCVGNPGYAPDNAQYVVLALDGTLTVERVLTAGDGITITDGGAETTVTVAAEWKDDGTGTLVPVTANDDVYATSSNDNYTINGDNTQASGSSVGVYGTSSGGSTDAAGVEGYVDSTATTTYGGVFTNNGGGTTDYGVYATISESPPGNSDYSVYSAEHTFVGFWTDFDPSHAPDPIPDPSSGILPVFADEVQPGRSLAQNSSSVETDRCCSQAGVVRCTGRRRH